MIRKCIYNYCTFTLKIHYKKNSCTPWSTFEYPHFRTIALDQWFSNWDPRSFWGPRENFLGTAKHIPKKSTRRSWRKKFCV